MWPHFNPWFLSSSLSESQRLWLISVCHSPSEASAAADENASVGKCLTLKSERLQDLMSDVTVLVAAIRSGLHHNIVPWCPWRRRSSGAAVGRLAALLAVITWRWCVTFRTNVSLHPGGRAAVSVSEREQCVNHPSGPLPHSCLFSCQITNPDSDTRSWWKWQKTIEFTVDIQSFFFSVTVCVSFVFSWTNKRLQSQIYNQSPACLLPLSEAKRFLGFLRLHFLVFPRGTWRAMLSGAVAEQQPPRGRRMPAQRKRVWKMSKQLQ